MIRKKKKILIDVLCGGVSSEHDVSVISALSILNQLVQLQSKYKVHIVYIDKKGSWYRTKRIINSIINKNFIYNLKTKGIHVSPSVDPSYKYYYTEKKIKLPDIFFPVLHGPNGEDGALQGFFQIMNIPFVGCGVVGGSCGMDKEVMRKLFESYNLPLLPWISFYKNEFLKSKENIFKRIKNNLKFPIFVKPASLGSSVGIKKVNKMIELENALNYAFSFCSKVVVEEGRNVREIECSVLGNDNDTYCISKLGEIIPGSDFYNFEDKYLSKEAKYILPAKIPIKIEKKINKYANIAFRAINGKGLSRIDFFLTKNENEIFINEVNTFPGFTEISMYPKLWQISGIKFKNLLIKLITLGFENFNTNKNIF